MYKDIVVLQFYQFLKYSKNYALKRKKKSFYNIAVKIRLTRTQIEVRLTMQQCVADLNIINLEPRPYFTLTPPHSVGLFTISGSLHRSKGWILPAQRRLAFSSGGSRDFTRGHLRLWCSFHGAEKTQPPGKGRQKQVYLP